MPDRDAQRWPDDERLEPGARLAGRFELIERAGAGGMGEVFRARDLSSGALVAVKVLGERQPNDEARFAREAQTLAELSHPAIVRYTTHGFAGEGRPYLVMEWLEGEDLARRLRRGPLSLASTLGLGARVAAALAAAHARGIVHRDVKPANIFLVGGDVADAKVLDFGIAQRRGQTALTRPGTILGTLGYMAPEQARSGGDIGPPSDVFALGCVLFECLAGRPAFSDDLVPVLAKILLGEVPRLREIVPDVPPALDDLVVRMLDKDPAARPPDGAALAAALADVEAPVGRAQAATARAQALTGGERRVASVVLVKCRSTEPLGAAPTVRLDDTAREHEWLSRAAEAHQGRFVALADGSSLVAVTGSAAATDGAAAAARCALALRALFPADRSITLATVRSAPRDLFIGASATRLASPAASPAAGDQGAQPIPIDDVTAGLLDARFDVGESETGEGLVLRGERPVAEGARTLLGRPTPCVGRERELRTAVADLAEGVEQSRGVAVLITGAAGIGKSRLLQEVLREIRARHPALETWIGRGDPLRARSAFGLIGQALRGAAGIRDGAPLDERRVLLSARVARHVPAADRSRVTELLGELAAVPFPDEDSPQLRAVRAEPMHVVERLRWAFQDFLAAECAAHPVLLVLEDLHWGDLPTMRLVDTALRELEDRPFLVLALARSELHELAPRLWAERNLQLILLGELSRKAGERLVRQVLGPDVGEGTVERLVARSGGHAFYLEELIRARAEGDRGASLPETVLAMVEARLGNLEDEARRVLRAASVFGEVFWKGGVIALLGDGAHPTPVGDWLDVLVEREVLVPRRDSRFPGEIELAFRHALLREGAYAMLTEEDRVLGHRLAAGWLERADEIDPMVLAEHFEHGAVPARAAVFLAQATRHATVANDVDLTMDRARRGLALVRALPAPERAALQSTELALLEARMDGHGWRNEWQEGLACANEALQLAEPGSESYAQAAASVFSMLLAPGQDALAWKTLDVLSTVDPFPGALRAYALALILAVYFLGALGRSDAADAAQRRVAALVDTAGDREPLALAWRQLTAAFSASMHHEAPGAGLRWSEAALASFEGIGHRGGILLAQATLGISLWLLGASRRAADVLRPGMASLREMGPSASFFAIAFAGAMADIDAIDEAEQVFAQLLAHLDTSPPYTEGHARWALAMLSLRRGDLDAAEHEATAAVEKLAMVPRDQACATATLAAVLLARGRTAEALAAAREAMRRAEANRGFGFRGSFIRLVHAEALLAAGHVEEARGAIAAARCRLHAQAADIDDPALRRSFLDGVAENARTLALAAELLDG